MSSRAQATRVASRLALRPALTPSEGIPAFDLAAATLAGPELPRPPATAGVGPAAVIVPTHNDGGNIEVLLERLVEEPCVGEILVVASGCDDDTAPKVQGVAAAHRGKIRLYVERHRSGKAAAVNFALGENVLPFVVVVSGDVLPAPGAVGRLVEQVQQPGVGLAGGRPVPANSESERIGYGVHLLWRLHHRLALHQPKLGEMIAIRAEAVVLLPRTSVDEACFQALIEGSGWLSAYVPDAVVRNLGPCTAADFLKQRRQIHAGHLWLRHRHHYTVPSLRPTLLAAELWRDLTSEPERLRPRRLAWTASTAAIEASARFLARLDYLRGRENHVWDMVKTTKPSTGLVPAGPASTAGAAAVVDLRTD
jgi:hypothetical protein